MVELELSDDEAIDDMRLLLRLTYGPTYTSDAGVLLDLSTRLRLAVLGNALEFVDCVEECLRSVVTNLTFIEALTCLDEIPEELRPHAAIAGLPTAVIRVIVSKVEKTASWRMLPI